MTAPSAIVILEDDPRRSNEMRRVLTASTVDFDVVFFDNAYEMREWLAGNMPRVVAMSLDCDLDTTTVLQSAESGCGEDIARYLADLSQTFPIVIHSSNAMRAPAMHMTLVLAGWDHVALSPYTDATSWLCGLVEAIGDSKP